MNRGHARRQVDRGSRREGGSRKTRRRPSLTDLLVIGLFVALAGLVAYRFLVLPVGTRWGVWLGVSPRSATPRLKPAASGAAPRDQAAALKPALGPLAGPINTTYFGVSMFRGNAQRNYYGKGPVPRHPKILWRFPESGTLSGPSSEGGETKIWSGTGWTGQPVVYERKDGKTEVIFGAYDHAVHFLDAKTGKRLRSDFKTGDIIKGAVMLDPDGYPLLYFGSRDNYYRILALDRGRPKELWRLSAYVTSPVIWNNDWDSSGVVVNDYLFEGGENSHFFIIKLNRGYDARGRVRVRPRIVFDFPAFDEDLLAKIGDNKVSIESSPAVDWKRKRVYFTNGGGMVYGVDISDLGKDPVPRKPRFPLVFKFWMGDDTDATPVLDNDGKLYVASEFERHTARSRKIGQIAKLDPMRPERPLVWSVKVMPKGDGDGGVYATPVLWGKMLYVPTHQGQILGISRYTGRVIWRQNFTWHAWGSPAAVDNVLVAGSTFGTLHGYDISVPKNEHELWKVTIPSKASIESAPVVWKGRVFVGSRDGHFYAFGDK